MDKNILIFKIKPSRIKALILATEEIKSFLSEIKNAEVVIGGPLSTEKGIIAAYIPKNFDIKNITLDFWRLGYVQNVYKMLPEQKKSKNAIKWKNKFYSLETLYEENKNELLNQAPDKRKFLLPDITGNLHYAIGYRGNGTSTGKRALPVEDSKMMLNLIKNKKNQKVLDPFAGAGGIVFAAKKAELDIYSSDIDSEMQYGLKDFGAKHKVADIKCLPFENDFFDAIVTEAPFDINATQNVVIGLEEMKRVIKPSGVIILMVADTQVEIKRKKAIDLNLKIYIDQPLNRKGTAVHIFKFEKNL